MVPEIAARTYLDPDGHRGVPAGAALPHRITHAAHVELGGFGGHGFVGSLRILCTVASGFAFVWSTFMILCSNNQPASVRTGRSSQR